MSAQIGAMSIIQDQVRLAEGVLTGLSDHLRGASLQGRDLAKTIRGKILFAFAAMAAITFLLGLAGMNSVDGVGNLVIESFDKPLASISYARLALAKFTGMQTALTRRQASSNPAQQAELDRRMSQLAQETGVYLRLAVSRATSPRAIAAARATAADVARWDAARRDLFVKYSARHDHLNLAQRGDAILDDFDRLVTLTAEDGLSARAQALAAIVDYRRLTATATLLALLVGGIIAFLLARRMVRPIAEASRAGESHRRRRSRSRDRSLAPAG